LALLFVAAEFFLAPKEAQLQQKKLEPSFSLVLISKLSFNSMVFLLLLNFSWHQKKLRKSK